MDAQHLQVPGAMQKQKLLVEFNSLKTACPQGVYMSLSPNDPALWTGVIFVRTGPYAPAILRFQISFPATYPIVPPSITFSTDIFHPLVAPLTVQLYTSSEDDSTGIIILDDERLPPGGFSLRHGFPSWFKRTRITTPGSPQTPAEQGPPKTPVKSPKESNGSSGSPMSPRVLSPGSGSGSSTSRDMADPEEGITIFELLRYIRSTFDDTSVLDEVPLEAAGNSGAWRAWKSYRTQQIEASLSMSVSKRSGDGENRDNLAKKSPLSKAPRQPGEWNWEGVWEVRAKKGIDLSVSEASLFGNATSNDELINFLQVGDGALETIKENMKRILSLKEA